MIRVLYVDDEKYLLELTKEFLELSGELLVDTSASVKEAEEKLLRSDYDAIISDYQMPEMSGIEFLKRLRSRNVLIPFILFTGRGREEVVIEALNSGADFYMQKGGAPLAQFAELENYVKQGVHRYRSDRAKRESEERFRGLVENSFEGVSVHVDRVLVEANLVFCQITGYSREELIGMRMEELFARSSWGTIMERLKLPVSEPFDAQIVGKNGTIKRVKARGKDITWNGRAARFSTILDLPDTRDIERQLMETEGILHNLIEMSPDIVWEIDERGLFTYISPKVRDVLGYDERDLLGRSALDLAAPGFTMEAENFAALSLTEPKKFITRFDTVHKNGGLVRIELRGAPFFGPDGHLRGFRGIARKLAEDGRPPA